MTADSVQAVERSWLDRVGITASVACAIHCMAAPFLMLLLPAAGSVWSHPAVHWVLAVLVLPLAVWVIYRGYLKHRKRWTLISAGLGSACIVAGLILPMIDSWPVVSFALPGFGSNTPTSMLADAQAPSAAEPVACTEACCPSVTQDVRTGGYTLAIPPGGLVTFIGSLFLVFAHTTNLIACRCFARRNQCDADGTSACGCSG